MEGGARGAEGSTVSVLGTTEERRLLFEKSIRNDGKALAQLAFCLCGHRATAEDLTAEAFARTWGPHGRRARSRIFFPICDEHW